MTAPSLWVGTRSHVGLERDHNEDEFLCNPDLGIFAVIDGVGGELGGEVAAKKAAEVLLGRLSRLTAPPRQRMREAITLANNAIFDSASQNPSLRGMSCVLTVAVLEGECLTVGHVGDTRLYLLRRGEIVQVTHDHSPIGMLEEWGEISEEEAMHHPRRSEILRDVGSQRLELESPEFVDLHEIRFGPDEAFLLCSDGLSDQVATKEILATVEQHAGNPQEAAKRLTSAANRAGGKDNVTVVLVEGASYPDAVRSARQRPGAKTDRLVAEPAAPSPNTQTTAPRGGAAARPGWLRTVLEKLPRRLFLAGLLLVLAASSPWIFRFVARFVQESRFSPNDERAVVRVGEEGFATRSIAEALATALPGQVIEVEPGTYDQPLRLRDGVSLVSRVPRQALIRLRVSENPGGAVAILADGVHDAKVEGFKIAGDREHPLNVGIRLVNAAVQIENVEITGALKAAVEIIDRDRSTLAYSLLAKNIGPGVLVRGLASTRVLANLIEDNGHGLDPPSAGVEISGGAMLLLHDNRFTGNAAAAARGIDPSQVDEVIRRNQFDGKPPGSAVLPAAPESDLVVNSDPPGGSQVENDR